MGFLNLILSKICIAIISLYQHCIAPFIAPCCRFNPSCSVYTKKAIEKYGIIKGATLGIRRMSCCHPWGKSGYDPVK